MSARQHLGYAILGLVVLGGLAVLLREFLRARRGAAPPPRRLAAWPGSLPDLLLFLLCPLLGAFVLPSAVDALLRRHFHDADQRQVCLVLSFQLGLSLGLLVHRLAFGREPIARPAPLLALKSGAAAFLAAWPVLIVTGLVWGGLLQLFGVPLLKQDQVAIFESLHSWLLRGAFALFAGVIAPANEELIFRAGLYRFCRGRMARWAALLIPAVLFGASHLAPSVADGIASLAQLVMLAVVFSLAYERTGRIGTPIVAHALYNIATMALLLLGVDV
ncbi:MAG TPA: type II CAAX endopeptidase family protein [Opitutaceae bacterium]|nr:type II CAAX endopeptidase family protein [Opitutaceae bacterium]